MTINIKKITYGGWPNCYRLSNGRVELILTTDVGPRIMRFAFVGDENILNEYAHLMGQTGGDAWVNYGGHRFWHAPEDPVRTYYPDNSPVEFVRGENVVRAIAPREQPTGMQKELIIKLAPESAEVEVVHRLHNKGLWPVKAAPWALSVMRAGGQGIMLQPPRMPHPECLVPTSSLVMWSYTNLADARWSFSDRTIRLNQEPTATYPQKAGLHTTEGLAAYHWQHLLFIKQVEIAHEATYPDMGSRVELFTNRTMLEVETLGPLTIIDPSTHVDHVENWTLHRLETRTVSDEYLLTMIQNATRQ